MFRCSIILLSGRITMRHGCVTHLYLGWTIELYTDHCFAKATISVTSSIGLL